MNNRENSHALAGAPSTVRADLHCHSNASAIAKLGVQRALALPECATPPWDVYELAKRRGMDFVTITDHDSIAGVLELAAQLDVFISEELTAWFKDEPQAVHVLCFGITTDDHDWLQASRRDVAACAEYLHEHEIACALAHPFFHVAAPLTPAHRRTLAQLFPVWETRNGARARELNAPAAIYIETHGGVAVGGSDDHAGVDIGRTYTEAPPAETPAELLEHIRAGRVAPHGKQGSAAKWAHGAIMLGARTLGATGSRRERPAPDARATLELAERIMIEGDARDGSVGAGLGPESGRELLSGWLAAMDLEPDCGQLLAMMQAADFSHSDLERGARHTHERKLAAAVQGLVATALMGERQDAAAALFTACLPAVPYIPAAAFLAREQSKLTARDDEPFRIAVIAEGIASMHGVTHTLAQLRERGAAGYEIELIGTDPRVDRRLSAVVDAEVPFYPGMRLGVPSLFAVAQALTDGRYGLVHVCAPGPIAIAALVLARVMGLPVVGSYHTELHTYAGLRSGSPAVEQFVQRAMATFYGQCRVVLSPSRAADRSLAALGVGAERVRRWDRGVDLARFSPDRRDNNALSDKFNVLYVGRLSQEKGIDLLAEAFLLAHDRDPRLHLTLAGGGPEEEPLRRRLGTAATFLGWVEGDELPRVYASADLFMFTSTTDTFGQVILEAQASGLAVLAVDAGGPGELIDDGRSGCLTAPDPEALASALIGLARRDALRARVGAGGLIAVRDRSWTASLRQLADGYARAIYDAGAPPQAANAA